MFKLYSMSESGVYNGYTTWCCLAVATRPEAVGISIIKPTIMSAVLLLCNNSMIFKLMGCLLSNQKKMKHSIEPCCCIISPTSWYPRDIRGSFSQKCHVYGEFDRTQGSGDKQLSALLPPSISCLPVSGLLEMYVSPVHTGSSHLPSMSLVSQSSSFLLIRTWKTAMIRQRL